MIEDAGGDCIGWYEYRIGSDDAEIRAIWLLLHKANVLGQDFADDEMRTGMEGKKVGIWLNYRL